MDKAATPPRVVGPIASALMNVNGMIGAGIFAMPAILYSTLGSFAPWMILLVGSLVGCSSLVMAQLASMFRQSGGPQLYAQVAFGDGPGFQIGWLLLCAVIASRAANFHVLVTYLAAIFPFFDDALIHTLTVLALIGLITWINILGMKAAVGGLLVGTGLKLCPILLVCLVGYAEEGIVAEFRMPTFGAVESTALLVYYAFSGGFSNTYAAGEVANPRRTIPRSIIVSLASTIALYMFVQFAFNAVKPEMGDGGTPLAAMGGALLGDKGSLLMALAAIFSIATNQHSMYMAGPRVLYGMARRGLLPATFTHVSPRGQVPDRAIYMFSGLIALLSLTGGFAFLAEVMGVAAQIVTLSGLAAFIVLRRKGQENHPLGVGPSWYLCIALAASFAIFAASQADLVAFALLGGLIVLGTGLYFVARSDETFVPEPEFD
jgi:amino acid transporter